MSIERFCLGSLVAMLLAAANVGRGETRPNVLVLFADDQRADTIAALGNSAIQTPNLDKLVRRGVAFDSAYMQGGNNGATCVPSRAMLLSGQCLFRIDEKLLRDETWPAVFGRSGYSTFVSGKWHNGESSLPKCFQEARGLFLGGMTNPLSAKLTDLADGKLLKPQIAPKHACAVFADEAINFIQRKHERPFFCYIPFDAPHDPHVVPDDFAIHYAPDEISLPPNFQAQHPFDNGEMAIRDEQLLEWPRSETATKKLIAEYYRYVSYLDFEIGRILEALQATPGGENTIVVFAADSGVARGSHGLIGKQNCYEHSMRVPLIVAGPGIAKNQRTNALCYLFDLLPTLGSLCGVEGPTTSQGIAFTETLVDPAKPARSEIMLAYRSVQRAVRDSRMKLIRYPQINRTQLFDLQSDPHELKDLSMLPEYRERVQSMMELLADRQRHFGDELPLSCPTPQPAEWKPPKNKGR